MPEHLAPAIPHPARMCPRFHRAPVNSPRPIPFEPQTPWNKARSPRTRAVPSRPLPTLSPPPRRCLRSVVSSHMSRMLGAATKARSAGASCSAVGLRPPSIPLVAGGVGSRGGASKGARVRSRGVKTLAEKTDSKSPSSTVEGKDRCVTLESARGPVPAGPDPPTHSFAGPVRPLQGDVDP